MVLITYALHLLAYGIFLIQQGIAFRNKHGYLCEVSGLGEAKNEKHKIYNLGYFAFGFSSLFFTYNLTSLLLPGYLTTLGQISLYISGISLCIIALFPRDKSQLAHTIASFILFISGVLGMIFLIYPFYKTTIIPNHIILMNIAITSVLIFYSYLKLRNIKKYGINNQMEKYVSPWEWVVFISSLLWNLILTILII